MGRNHTVGNVILGLILAALFVLVVQSFRTQLSTQTVLLGVVAGLMAVIVMQSAKWGNETVEYKTAAAGSIDSSALEKFGRDGWRLVCVDSATGYIFTR
jgi:uncharacterized membrane protein